MFTIKKSPHNPLLTPNTNEPWEAYAVFNWCPIQDGKITHYVYRAESSTESYFGNNIKISAVGYTSSKNGINFSDRRQFIFPEHEWEKYGCEDPRISKIDDNYYIFYTALSNYPYNADGIKIAVAVTKDFKKIEKKHLVTPFNAKAMVIFPERINGKIVALLSVDTDRPPREKLCIAEFNSVDDIFSKEYWENWYKEADLHRIDPRRTDKDHVEVGAVPIKTKDGWLLIYSYIENYHRDNNPFKLVFGVEALLLDLKNPRKILGSTKGPMFVASEIYEEYGQVPDIIFPSGALLKKDTLEIYYGAADTVCAKATVSVKDLLESLKPNAIANYFTRYDNNPILKPRHGVSWEAHGVFNPSSLQIGKLTYILYRAMSDDDTSYIGFALSRDGFNIDERSDKPIYVPRKSFEMKTHPGNSGCEDPRLTLIGDIVYMCYTAYDGSNPPRVAVSAISLEDFKNKNWNWTNPMLISPNNKDDKDACIFPEKIKDKYLMLHRVNNDICADFIDSLEIVKGPLEIATPIILPRKGMWDSEKVGITAPPIKTKEGWILLYHGVSSNHHTYRVGMALLDLENPLKVIARASTPVFTPEMDYEKIGVMPNVVFPCGTALREDTLFVYYGAADDVVGVATVSIKKLINSLL